MIFDVTIVRLHPFFIISFVDVKPWVDETDKRKLSEVSRRGDFCVVLPSP